MLEQKQLSAAITCPEKFRPRRPVLGAGLRRWAAVTTGSTPSGTSSTSRSTTSAFTRISAWRWTSRSASASQRYDSISGEELNPYRRLSAGDIQTIVGGRQRYRALIHQRIPIHAVGVEIFPAYYEDFLKKQYPDEYFDLSGGLSRA